MDPIFQPFRDDPHYPLDRYEAAADLMLLNMGPQHPSTHGVFRLKLVLDGEIIVKAVPYMGYLHRGVEKMVEGLTFAQMTPIFNKHDYVSPMTNEQAYAVAVETALGIEVPRRARYIRTILAEIQRIASHLLWLSTFTLDMGGVIGGGAAMMMYNFREREDIFDLFEAVTGSRFHYNTHCIGGQRHDLPEGWVQRVRAFLDRQERAFDEYLRLIRNDIFDLRTKGVGVMSADLALGLGITGPNLRASGVDFDMRRDAPFHAYDEVEVRVAVAQGCDAYARYEVRMAEMRESVRILRLLLDQLPEGPICGSKPVKMANAVRVPDGRGYTAIEGPRGEIGTWLIGGGEDKGAKPFRLKIRPPSLHAMAAMSYLLPGHTVSDVVVVLGSLDPIMGEVDR
ncbi:MAG: NADH-quinone oxidoreductase subunit D [Deltaproteobacteria bacterium]|nr:NADH-quinone oxidoreductase subunit D [Deltaproteobacteria bacterium]